MKGFQLIISLGLLCFLFSCKTSVIVYYHDTRNYDDGEIWGSDLSLFFKNEEDIKINKIQSEEIYTELMKIKKELNLCENVVEIDDGFYEYAFVVKTTDTLYTNGAFEDWRYKNFKSKVTNSIKSLMEL